MILPLLSGIVCMIVSGRSVIAIDDVFPYNNMMCRQVPGDTVTWKAEIKFDKLVDIDDAIGGQVTHMAEDGRYIEMTGIAQSASHLVCVTIKGSFTGPKQPRADFDILPTLREDGIVGRDLQEPRFRRSTEIWRVSSVPETTDRRTLLKDFEPYHRQWGDDSLSGATKHSSTTSLTVHYAKGTYSQSSHVKGAGFYSTPHEVPDAVDQLILMYDVYFENFGFGNMGKLPGLFGGEKGDGAYACSGGNNPDTCFSLRLMWRSGGDGELYAYIPDNQESGFHDRPDVIGNSKYGQSIGRGHIKFQNGKWNTVMELVHLNTIGHTDGYVKFCNQVQGHSQQCYTASNLRMRNNPNHYIRGMFFSTFFGGRDPDDKAPNDCRAYFKNFRLKLPTGAVIG